MTLDAYSHVAPSLQREVASGGARSSRDAQRRSCNASTSECPETQLGYYPWQSEVLRFTYDLPNYSIWKFLVRCQLSKSRLSDLYSRSKLRSFLRNAESPIVNRSYLFFWGGDYDEHKHMTKKRSTRFHEPLRHGDSEKQTVGCRLTNPKSCGRNSLKGICAFARTDGMCLSPPKSWPKKFARLNKAKTGGGES